MNLSRKKMASSILFISIVTAMAFSPVIDNQFVNWDDDKYITENRMIQELTPSSVGRIFSTFIVDG